MDSDRKLEEARRRRRWLPSYRDDRFIVYPHKQLQQLVLRARERVGSYRKLAKMIHCWPESLWRYVNGKNAITVAYIQKICKLLGENLWNNATNAKFRNKYAQRRDFRATVTYPEVNTDVALILGASGDAYNGLTRGYSSYHDEDPETTINYMKTISKEFGVKYYGPRYNHGCHTVETQNITMNWLLHKAYKVPLGNRSRKLKAPPSIRRCNDPEILYAFLAGCISTEGSVTYNPKKSINVITLLSTTSPKFCADVKEIATKLGYHCYECRSGIGYKVNIARAEEIARLFYYVAPYLIKPSRTTTWIKMLSDHRFYNKVQRKLRRSSNAIPREFSGLLWAQRMISFDKLLEIRGAEFAMNLGELLALSQPFSFILM